jgi:subtilisin family serine protease
MLKHLFACCAVAAVLVLAVTPVDGQENEAFFYRFDTKVTGRLDTTILAVWMPPNTERERFSSVLGSFSERYLSEEEPFVKAFSQEGVVFLELAEAADSNAFSGYQDDVRAISPEAIVGHPFFAEDHDLPMIVTSEFVVRFEPEVSAGEVEEFNRTNGVEIVEVNPHVENQYLLRATGGVNALEMANRYQESGLAVFSQPNFLVHVQYYHTPTDPDYSSQWHLHNSGGAGMTADADIDADTAWDYEQGEAAVIVAVIDGGFEINHPDLDDNYLTNAGETPGNGVDDDGNGYVDDVDGWSFVAGSDDVSDGLWPYHGHSVAGLVAAEENGQMVVGVCPGCRLLLIANTFDINDLANAFYYARDRGAWVITNSWGSTDSTFDQPVLVSALADVATNGRGGLGIPIFFASGNDGGAVVAHPARDPNTIAVGGADCNDMRYTGSQYGPELDFLSTTRQGDGTCGLVTTGLGNTVGTSFGGTSGATPVAAGIAGLLLSLEPSLTAAEVREIMRHTAEKIDAAAAGYGPDGWSTTHGEGRVNAARAILPTVRISVSSEVVGKNEPFDVTVTASAPYGLTAVWWFGEETGITDLDKAHWHNVVGGEPFYSHTWTGVTIAEKGSFTLGANARDVLYPNPGDGYPHQASEGSGMDSAQIEVTPVSGVLGTLVVGLSFLVAGLRKSRNEG